MCEPVFTKVIYDEATYAGTSSSNGRDAWLDAQDEDVNAGLTFSGNFYT